MKNKTEASHHHKAVDIMTGHKDFLHQPWLDEVYSIALAHFRLNAVQNEKQTGLPEQDACNGSKGSPALLQSCAYAQSRFTDAAAPAFIRNAHGWPVATYPPSTTGQANACRITQTAMESCAGCPVLSMPAISSITVSTSEA